MAATMLSDLSQGHAVSDAYRYSAHHIQATTRLAVALALTPALLSVLVLVFAVLDKHWVLSAIVGVVSISLFFRSSNAAWSGLGEAEDLRALTIELSARALRISGPDGMVEIPLTTIKSIQIARRHGTTRAVSVNVPGEDAIVIAGLDRLEDFTTKLSRFLGQAKVSEYRWWQTHPV